MISLILIFGCLCRSSIPRLPRNIAQQCARYDHDDVDDHCDDGNGNDDSDDDGNSSDDDDIDDSDKDNGEDNN